MSKESNVCFYINDDYQELTDVRPDESLLDYIREHGLKGAKPGCKEGGCGACTVLLTKCDNATGKITHTAIASCLTPLPKVDGCVITTVEGLGTIRTKLHPIQQAIVDNGGTQCGYCTPGFVVTLADAFLNADKEQERKALAKTPEQYKQEKMKDIEETLDGNLCRCTGYRSILNAAADVMDHLGDDQVAAVLGKDTPLHRTLDYAKTLSSRHTLSLEFVTPGATHSTGIKKNPIIPIHWFRPTTLKELLAIKEEHRDSQIAQGCTEIGLQMINHVSSRTLIDISHVPDLHFLRLHTWQPTSDSSSPYKMAPTLAEATAGAEPALADAHSLVIGATTTVEELLQWTKAQRRAAKAFPDPDSEAIAPKMRVINALHAYLMHFASHHIRSMATVVANLCLCSPVSDTIPVMQALDAVVHLQSASDGIRPLPAREFMLGLRKNAAAPNELVTHLTIPFPPPRSYFICLKQAKRQEDDISIANASFLLQLREPTADEAKASPLPRIADAALFFGGMSWRVVGAPRTLAFLRGAPEAGLVQGDAPSSSSSSAAAASSSPSVRVFDRDTLSRCLPLLSADLPLEANAPGGMIHYRRALCLSLFYGFYVQVINLIATAAEHPAQKGEWAAATAAAVKEKLYDPREIVPLLIDEAVPGLRPTSGEGAAGKAEEEVLIPPEVLVTQPTRGQQDFAEGEDTHIVGKAIPHIHSRQQATGEAVYSADTSCAGELFGAFVFSTHAHAKIVSLDASAALAMKGVVKYVSAGDLRGSNVIGAPHMDEQVFYADTVTAVGQIIGVVVAETDEIAHLGAAAVKIQYEDLSPVISTIDDAIEHQSFFLPPTVYKKGDVTKGLAECDRVFEGEVRLAGQIHASLETQNTLAIPLEDGRMQIICATQNPSATQRSVASCCGTNVANVSVTVPRLGGSFGGKESRSVFISCAAAAAANAVNRPVHVILNRSEDLANVGHRHPFMAKYKVGIKTVKGADGAEVTKLHALHVTFYNNAGYSRDLSGGVMNRALTHCDNTYEIPHVTAEGYACKTNRQSNTAFRGFGAPQGVVAIEVIIERIAAELGMDPMQLRQDNFYHTGDITPFGQEIEDLTLTDVNKSLLASSNFYARRAAVAEFNKTSRWVKRGIAYTPLKFGLSFETRFLNQAGALVHVHQDGSVRVNHGALEMGQGVHTKMAMVAAEELRELGCTLADVRVAETSTDTVSNTSPTAASTGSDLNGMAVQLACREIKERMLPVRDRLLQAKKEKGDAAPAVTFAEVAKQCNLERVDLTGHGFYATPTLRPGKPFAYLIFGASVTEVEVNCLTGALRVVRADVTYDSGTSLNPMIDLGQLEGAFVQGLGYFLLEEPMWSEKASLINRTLGFYKLPAISTIPFDFRAALLKNRPNAFPSIHRSKGVGEPPLILALSSYFAAVNAVDAARREFAEEKEGAAAFDWTRAVLPATCERLRMFVDDPICKITKTEGIPQITNPN